MSTVDFERFTMRHVKSLDELCAVVHGEATANRNTVLLAGGGIRGGATFGSSDKMGAYPATDPVTPADLAATIYWRFGLDPETEMHDQTGRPYRLAEGRPITSIFS